MSKLRSGAVFALCGLFAVLCMGLALLSSGAYRAVAAAAQENYTHRTALSYLVNQVRRADEQGGVALGTFGDSDALRLTEWVDGTAYETLIYCYDGQLMELYVERGYEFGPSAGNAILPLDSLTLDLDGGVLTLTAALGDETYTASVSPRCGLEEVGGL